MDINMKKKAVAVLYAARGVYDFLWYYSTYGKEYDWIAVCGWYGKSDVALELCQNAGVFKEVIWTDERFDNKSFLEAMKEFLKMSAYYICGKRNLYCQKLIERNLNKYDYDLAVVSNPYGMLYGAIISTANIKEVVILEDGLGDYKDYSVNDLKYLIRNWYKPYEWAGYLIAKMGYANPGKKYTLKTTKACDKFATHPEKIAKEQFREVKKLRDMRETDERLYEQLITRTFGFNATELEGDVVFFTSPLDDLIANNEEAVLRTIDYFNKYFKGKKLLLKQHPRDKAEYVFDESVIVKPIDRKVPGEIFLELLRVKEVIFEFPCALMDSGCMTIEGFKVLDYRGLCVESKWNGRSYKDIFEYGIKEMAIPQENIITII